MAPCPKCIEAQGGKIVIDDARYLHDKLLIAVHVYKYERSTKAKKGAYQSDYIYYEVTGKELVEGKPAREIGRDTDGS